MTVTIVAIDGPGGSGKSTIASRLAERLAVPMLSTGLFFRVAAWGLAPVLGEDRLEPGFVEDWFDHHRITVKGDRALLDGGYLGEELRLPMVQQILSLVAADSTVRRRILELERAQISSVGSCVVEGRDIGSVVWPQAICKFYLVARQQIRIERRPEEGLELIDRDRKDSVRRDAPLRMARDAFLVDNSDEPVEVLVDRMARLVALQSERASVEAPS
ncbi:(d)CMP kinase [Ferrimicrobium sp.]|uniref:(d)CMP kinase n=1 Tax=Ferrimicrobium sp. TaxID=2926050 RepID=UPI002633198D|nr:(d)CMP kinase [Ferrimicrobium sp.]